MSRPLIVDTFMINDELDMLECRLDTMAEAVDWFVAVEADVDLIAQRDAARALERLADRVADRVDVRILALIGTQRAGPGEHLLPWTQGTRKQLMNDLTAGRDEREVDVAIVEDATDVREGLVSVTSAERDYGVVVRDGAVDEAATGALRG